MPVVMCCAFTQFFCCAITQGEKEHPDINSRQAPPWRSGQEEPQTQARKRIIIAHPEHYRYRAPISAVTETPRALAAQKQPIKKGQYLEDDDIDNIGIGY